MNTTAPANIVVGLNAVIVTVSDEEEPCVLVVQETDASPADVLPFGPFNPDKDRTLEEGLRSWVVQQTNLEIGYVEQLYTFGNRGRDPRERKDGARFISVGYLALVRDAAPPGGGAWQNWYAFFPWEDWRHGRPEILDAEILPALGRWVDDTPDAYLRAVREERLALAFGVESGTWTEEHVLDRFELLYEAGIVGEAGRDAGGPLGPGPGQAMGFDHRRILATGMGRLRGKIKYRPVIFELMPAEFTLFQLQCAAEGLAGLRLHKQNFRRLVERAGLVEETGRMETSLPGRPAKLFRFRRNVLRERPTPAVNLPRGG